MGARYGKFVAISLSQYAHTHIYSIYIYIYIYIYGIYISPACIRGGKGDFIIHHAAWLVFDSLRPSDAFLSQWTSHHQWLVAWQAPSHCLNRWCNIVNWSPRNKPQWNLIWKSYIFIKGNAFQNVVRKMGFFSSMSQRVNVDGLFRDIHAGMTWNYVRLALWHTMRWVLGAKLGWFRCC